jgi:uncharacterized ParB-like nuclease family protein
MLLSILRSSHRSGKAKLVNCAPGSELKMAGCARTNARSRADTQQLLSKIIETSHDSTERLYQSIMATRDIKPCHKRT